MISVPPSMARMIKSMKMLSMIRILQYIGQEQWLILTVKPPPEKLKQNIKIRRYLIQVGTVQKTI